MFSLEPVAVKEQVPETPPMINKKVDAVDSPSVEALSAKANAEIKDLFANLREQVLALDEAVSERATTYYVAYRAGKNFAEVHIGKSQLQIYLRATEYDDPRKLVEKLPDGYNWTLSRRAKLSSTTDLDYVLGLIEQSYNDVI